MGKTINEVECLTCKHKNVKEEEFYTLSTPIPIKDEVNFEVIFVPRCLK